MPFIKTTKGVQLLKSKVNNNKIRLVKIITHGRGKRW